MLLLRAGRASEGSAAVKKVMDIFANRNIRETGSQNINLEF